MNDALYISNLPQAIRYLRLSLQGHPALPAICATVALLFGVEEYIGSVGRDLDNVLGCKPQRAEMISRSTDL